MGLRPGPDFHRRLCRAAAADFWAFVLGPPRAHLHPAAAGRLEAMRRGPSLLLTAHFHDWERLGRELKLRGVPLLAAALPFQNRLADAALRGLRRLRGVPAAGRGLPRLALRHLRGGGCFAQLWDQHAPGSDFRGRFYGLPVRMNPLPLFALRHNPCPVVFGAILPGGPLRLVPLLSDFRDGWEGKLIRRYHRVLECLVRAHPDRWYGFFHARFKDCVDYPGHRK
jgi:lauroyl/myristoyl acyltransferase